MPGISDLKRVASKLGALVEDDSSGGWRVFQVMAPAGKSWASSTGVHMLRVEWPRDQSARLGIKVAAIEDAIDRMAAGLVDCVDQDCDYCHSETE